MLQELIIKNYALIESLRLEFLSGFNIFTGETGAGKTIIIEALQLILGNRASSELIRKGADSASICGVFDIEKNIELKKLLQDQNLVDSSNQMLIIRREIEASGKSRCYCNDQPVTLSMINQIGDFLVDIHGQYEHQVLLKSVNQLNLLDRYGDLQSLRAEVSNLYLSWQKSKEELNSLKLSQTEREHKIDIYSFQIKEINNAELKPDETEEIEKTLPQLKNAEKLMSMSEKAYNYLDGGEDNILSNLNKIQKLARNISDLSRDKFQWADELENITSSLKDIADEIQSYHSNLEVNPKEFERLIERKDLILKLKRKYGQSIDEILSHRDKINAELDKLLHSQENINELGKEVKITENKLELACSKLSTARKKAGERLEKFVQKELRELGMPEAKFKIKISSSGSPSTNKAGRHSIKTAGGDTEEKPKITSHGWDLTEFVFSPNVGEDLKPLKDIASGGEMSRTMLALKTTLGKADSISTMIYDEIDSGVSGPMGQVIGQKLLDLSGAHQILCITHLAQIASFADRHFYIDKYTKSGRTYTVVNPLDKDRRVDEISRMLSGEKITQVTRQHAKELLSQARKGKK